MYEYPLLLVLLGLLTVLFGVAFLTVLSGKVKA
jgi:hypothetical protein